MALFILTLFRLRNAGTSSIAKRKFVANCDCQTGEVMTKIAELALSFFNS